ncbi:MAG: FadR/GntR family transcriptional regulator [Fusobacteriaceae bacterium]
MKSNSEKVFIYLKDKITKDEWKENERITPEIALSIELKVSRNSVREAIEKMVGLGILEKMKGKGTFVKKRDCGLNFNEFLRDSIILKSNYLEVLEFRKEFEIKNVKLFIKNASPEDFKELEESYQNMLETKESKEKFPYYDAMFHDKIAKGTKNSIIIKISEILSNLMIQHQRNLNDILGYEKGILEHKLILDAVKLKDEELAELYCRRHVERTVKDVEQIL